MGTENGRKVHLADVEAPIEPVVLPDGSEHAVRPLDALGYEVLRDYRASQDELLMWKLAALCLPQASEEQVRGLTGTQVGCVIALATHQLDKVEQLLAGKEEPPTTRAKGSKSKTPSGTPSPG